MRGGFGTISVGVVIGMDTVLDGFGSSLGSRFPFFFFPQDQLRHGHQTALVVGLSPQGGGEISSQGRFGFGQTQPFQCGPFDASAYSIGGG